MSLEKMNDVLLELCSELIPEKTVDLDTLRKNIELIYESKKNIFSYDVRSEFQENFKKIEKENDYELGLNTFGILLDRLTILNAKFFFLDDQAIHVETKKQINGILFCLRKCKPAKTVILAKETGERLCEIDEKPFQVLLRLQKSNLAQWVNQDLLYTADPSLASYQRLKSYVVETRYDNTIRNRAIEKLDFWFCSNFYLKTL
jgi:hypothetical protein